MNNDSTLSELAGHALVACANLENAILSGLLPSRQTQLNEMVAAGCLVGVETLVGASGAPSIYIVAIHPNGVREPFFTMLMPEPATRH
jgi:hypothetical protein